jgi:hypothetical protein
MPENGRVQLFILGVIFYSGHLTMVGQGLAIPINTGSILLDSGPTLQLHLCCTWWRPVHCRCCLCLGSCSRWRTNLLIWKADICTELSCNWSSLWSSRPTRPSGPLVQSLQVWTDPWNPGLTSTILPLKILQVNKRRSQSPPFFQKLAVAYWGLKFGFADHHYSIIMVHKLCLSNSVVEL